MSKELKLEVGKRYMVIGEKDFENDILYFVGKSVKNSGYHGYFEYPLGYFHLNKASYSCCLVPAHSELIDYDSKEAEENRVKKLAEIEAEQEKLSIEKEKLRK